MKKSVLPTWNHIIVFVTLFFGFVSSVHAIDVTLQWLPNKEPNLAGYRVFSRVEGQSYDYANPSLEVAQASCNVNNLDENKTHYFVVRAFDTDDFESGDSNEVSLEAVPMYDNQSPTAVIAKDYVEATPGETVTLDGSGSTDADDGISSYHWQQVDGPPVTLSGQNSENVTFTAPAADQYGVNITLRLTITDSGGLQSTADCFVYITPEKTSDGVILEGQFDSNRSSAVFTITESGQQPYSDAPWPVPGTLTLNADGSFTYTPAAGYTGADSFSYHASDGTADSNTAQVSITVTGVNSAPAAVDDAYTTAESTPLVVAAPGVLGNDTDGDGDALTAVLNSAPTNGSLTLNADGSFTYMPAAGFNGADSFSYHASDGTADSNTATVSITVTATTVSVSFQDGVNGYAGTRDTKLMSQDPDLNFGGAIRLELDGSPPRSSLLYWDLASIPSGSIVHSVDVTVNITNASGHVYEFYESLQPWVESEATWNEYAIGKTWEIDGSDGFSDRGSTVLGSILGGKGLATISLNAAGVAMVQAWVDNPSSSHGFIILNYISATNGLDFSSRETGTVSERPKLTVTYSAGSP